MIRSAYATGLKGVGPECPTSSRDPKRYFYGAGTGHMALDEEGRFVLVNAGRRVYMSSVACYEADVYHALLRARRIWVGTITAFDRRTGLVSVSFLDSQVDPLDIVKLVSDEPVTGTERPSFYIVDTSHLSSSLLGRKAHGYTYLNARPDDTYPDSRYEHVSTGSTSHAASPYEAADSDDSPESLSAEAAGTVESVEPEPESDAEVDQWLLSRISVNAAPAPPVPRLIYPPLKPPRRLRTRRASKRSR